MYKATDNDIKLIEKYITEFKLEPKNLKKEQFIVAKYQNKLVGFGRLKPYSDCTEISAVGVVPKYRNRGIGKRIINELISIGPKKIYITTDIPEYFYRFGFKRVDKSPDSITKKCARCITIRNNIVVLKLINPQ